MKVVQSLSITINSYLLGSGAEVDGTGMDEVDAGAGDESSPKSENDSTLNEWKMLSENWIINTMQIFWIDSTEMRVSEIS